MDEGADRRRRRKHSAEFKAEAIAACRKRGVSIAAAAMQRSINANLLRRWVVEAERSEARAGGPAKAPVTLLRESFVPVALPAVPTDETPIRIEVQAGYRRPSDARSRTISVQ